jgi:DNA-binding transcriptional MerR regulator
LRRGSSSSPFETAALRSRLVSRLTGLSASRLQYWHSTALQTAHLRQGARGVPRLYTWIDYQRLCVISSLLDQGIPAGRIRAAVHYLDVMESDWYRLSLTGWFGAVCVPGSRGAAHVAIKKAALTVLADAAGQATFRDDLAGDGVQAVSAALATGLTEVAHRGSLFKLSAYGDAVLMNPEVNVGLPTLEGTRLETSFVAKLVHLSSVQEVAELYELRPALVERGVEFEREAA